MVILTARDGAGNVIQEEHPDFAMACMAAEAHIHDGFGDIDMEEKRE